MGEDDINEEYYGRQIEDEGQDFDEEDNRFNAVVLIIIAVSLIILIFWPGTTAHGAEIPKWEAIYCVVGESENQGYAGMRAVAMALRTRGTTKGVAGCTSRRVKEHLYSAKIFVRALKAWETSRGLNCTFADDTQCADSWYSREDLKKDPGITDRCVLTSWIGDHVFFICDKRSVK